jgi:hypothetical protein
MENEKKIASQNDKILEWLKTGKAITPIDALNMFGCFRLAARIADLRKSGYDISTTTILKRNDDGKVKQYAEYRLEG